MGIMNSILGLERILKPYRVIITNLILTKLGLICKFRPKWSQKIGSRSSFNVNAAAHLQRPFSDLACRQKMSENQKSSETFFSSYAKNAQVFNIAEIFR
jgi:hypothetical protein